MSDSSSKPPASLQDIARPIFLAWEKLRLLYLLVLTLLTSVLILGEGFSELLSNGRFWMLVIEGIVVANLCYFAGPIVETYSCWLGFQLRWLRPALFVLGTLSACFLVVALLGTLLLPFPD